MLKNLAAVLYKANDIRLEERPVPEPKDDEVQVRVAYVGICGSDVHYLTHGGIGAYRVTDPMVMGHEASGVVTKVGAAVTTLRVGDRVALEPGASCRRCDLCRQGRYNLCPRAERPVTAPNRGSLTNFTTQPADFCHKLPACVSLEEGALLEPLCVGVHACRRGGVAAGARVLVSGAGPVGLLTLLAARALGAQWVVVTDVLQRRLELALELGADGAVDVGAAGAGAAGAAREALGGEADVAIDCSGFEPSVRLVLQVVKAGGKAVMVGLGADEVSVPLTTICTREIDIVGSYRYCNDYPFALRLVAEGRLRLRGLVSHRFPLADVAEALETARTGKGDPVKILVTCSDDE